MGSPYASSRFSSIFARPEDNQARTKRFLSGVSPFSRIKEQDLTPKTSDTLDSPDDGMSYFDQIQKIRGARGPALSAYQDALKSQPTRKDYEPSRMKRLAAAAISGAIGWDNPERGMAVAEDIKSTPYKEAVDEYTNKMRNLGESAKLEQDETETQIKGLSDAYAHGLKYKEFEAKQKKDLQDFTVSSGNLKVNQDRAAAYIESIRKPKHQYEPQEDGSILEIEEGTGKSRTIPAKTVAAANLRISGANARTAARNAETSAASQRDTAAYRGRSLNQRDKQIDINAKNADKKTKISPSQQQQAIDNAARLLSRDPLLKKYVEKDPDKDVYNPVEDDGSPMYKEFKKKMKALVTAELESGTPYANDEELDDDGSLLIIPNEN